MLMNRIRAGASAFIRSLLKIGGYFGGWLGGAARNGTGGYAAGGGGYAYGRCAEDIYWGYYTGDVFNSIQYGGLRERINDSMGALRSPDVDGHINPIARAVDVYKNVFRGAFNKEIKVESEIDGRPVSDKVAAAVGEIWRESKFDMHLPTSCVYAAAMGRCGYRIVADDELTAEDDPQGVGRPATVEIRIEDPRRIRDIRLDEHDNVEWVVLEYDISEGGPEAVDGVSEGTDDIHQIREVLTKDYYQKSRDGIAGPRIPNELGVCPYVLLRHAPVTGPGAGSLPCFYGALSALNRLNGVVANLARHVQQSVLTKWFMGGAGDPPAGGIDLGGDMTAIYVKLSPETPTPFLQPLVPKLEMADAVGLCDRLIEEIRDRLPELKATDGKFLSNQSGSTVAQLRHAAEALIVEARTRYEDALIRAIKIALSWGVMLGKWDLGTGVRSRKSADAAYRRGLEDFRFNTRPALAKTDVEQADQAVKEANRWASLATAAQGLVPVLGMDLFREMCLGLTEAENEQARKGSAEDDVQQIMPEAAGSATLEESGAGNGQKAKKKAEAA